MSSEETHTRLQSIFNSLSHSRVSSVSDLTEFLNSVSSYALSDPTNEEAKANALEALSRLSQFIASSSLTEEIADSLSLELPSVASRFGCVSEECAKIVAELIDRLVSTCNPRDMLPILCEGLAYTGDMVKVTSAYYVPLFRGLSKVIVSIRSRHFEQVKILVPVVLNVVKNVSSWPEDVNEDLRDFFYEALSIANSIKEVFTKVDGNVKEKLHALLGLYVLQIMALASLSEQYKDSSSNSLVTQLSSFLPYCGLTYISLMTEHNVYRMISTVIVQSEDDFSRCLSHVNLGAALSVIWGYIDDSARQAANEDLVSFEDELRKDQTKRWQAIGMLKHVLAYSQWQPLELNKQAFNIVLRIINGNISKHYDDEYSDCSEYITSLFAALKAVQSFIIHAPDTESRKQSYDVFKKILADIPPAERFEILNAWISEGDSPTMIGILFDILRSELDMEHRRRTEIAKEISRREESKVNQPRAFWNSCILELIEHELRSPKGGPPDLPEQSQSIGAALNLYRFVLIVESSGKTNYTGVMSKTNLKKAYTEWLLPLRTLVSGIKAESSGDHDNWATDAICAINPVELVLYRCIELIEENLKESTYS